MLGAPPAPIGDAFRSWRRGLLGSGDDAGLLQGVGSGMMDVEGVVRSLVVQYVRWMERSMWSGWWGVREHKKRAARVVKTQQHAS
jgi:hypothetical protein